MEVIFSDLWTKVVSIMDSRLPDWKDKIKNGGQPSAVQARKKGFPFSDTQIFEGVVKAVLSNSTDWSKVERVLPELRHLFKDFNLAYYSGLSKSDIDQIFLPWFKARSAASLTMRPDLTNLIGTARRLMEYCQSFGSLEGYFSSLLKMAHDNCMELACKIGSAQSHHKLPAMGIPIAAEMLKNIGYDVAKPDRHVNRAMGCFGMVCFSKWKDRSVRKPPEATETEMIEVMRAMDRFTKAIDVESVSFLDNAIWLLCAKSGLYFTNEHLCTLVGKSIPMVKSTNKLFRGKANGCYHGPKTVAGRKERENSMETLAEFVCRLSKSVGCYCHPCNSGYCSLKKFNTDIKGRMGIFAYVSELKRKALFRVDTWERFATRAGVTDRADEQRHDLMWGRPGVCFFVRRDSRGDDYQKAVNALIAIMNFVNP